MRFKEFKDSELTLQEKKLIWAHKISGSQIKEMINDPAGTLKNKIAGKYKELKGGKDLQRRLEMGNIKEEQILNNALGLDMIHPYTIDKRTFYLTERPLFTCNIDAYVGDDIDNIAYIIEVKNSSIDSRQKLYEQYKWQVLYYMWFFKAPMGKLLVEQQGVLRDEPLMTYSWDANKEELQFLSDFLDMYEDALKNKKIPDAWKDENLKVDKEEKEVVVEEVQDQDEILTIEKYLSIVETFKEIKKDKEAYEKVLKTEILPNKFAKIDGRHLYLSTMTRQTTQWEKATVELATMLNKYEPDFNLEAFVNKFKVSKEYQTLKNVKAK